MNNNIINEISKDLNIKSYQVEVTLKLLSEGNTIPFISRYRKEMTGSLDEEIIRKISDVYEYQEKLLKRKEEVIRLIDEKGLLTPELKLDIDAALKLVDVEDIYRPFKEKKKTKALDAIKAGLEPLANYIMDNKIGVKDEAKKYLNDKVKSILDAIIGAKYIIAERISDDAKYRKYLRNQMVSYGIIKTLKKKNAVDEKLLYENYYEYSEGIKYIKPHRILAINRAENEDVIKVSIEIDNTRIIDYIAYNYTRYNKENYELILEAINDAYKRLIFPSVEREVRSELKEISEESAISNFSINLEKLLLTPPIKEKRVIGFDPAFRTGCKLAVLDEIGKVLDICVIYPTEPHNKIEESEKILLNLIDKYDIDIIAIGNGTASRESESFVAGVIKKASKKVEYIIVSEAGASVYSASKEAIAEFPDLTVEKRSAISIGRRLQDSLAELVKIEPKSIGVGQYQHDVTPNKLDESLNFTITKVVNQVGVNINSASRAILSYISGLNKKCIEEIIKYRETTGKIKSRKEIAKVKGVSDKVYEQAIGFLRIENGSNPLDRTRVHPEKYELTSKILEYLKLDITNMGTKEFNEVLENSNKDDLASMFNENIITIEDVISNLLQPNRDPRDEMDKPLLKSDILKIEDIKVGTILCGTVRNVIDFGAFVDIGIKNDALVHISQITDKYIKHPSEVINVGDIISASVIDVNLEKGRVSLSMLNLKEQK